MLLPHYPCRLLHAERYSAQICSTVNEYSIMKGDIVCRGGDVRQDLILINTGIVTILCATHAIVAAVAPMIPVCRLGHLCGWVERIPGGIRQKMTVWKPDYGGGHGREISVANGFMVL